MPEILTESFCERCGTRYTFESAVPRTARLNGIKVLSRGLKNFVMSDDTSMDEAMAAARSETDREVTAHQLDAFHKTFNFCMTCRQYTCGNCWNDVDGRCLSCAPNLGHEILPAPFPGLDASGGFALGNGTEGANGSNGTNGHVSDLTQPPMAWPAADLLHDAALEAPEPPPVSATEALEADAPIDLASRLGWLEGSPTPTEEPDGTPLIAAEADAVLAIDAVDGGADVLAAADVETEALAAADGMADGLAALDVAAEATPPESPDSFEPEAPASTPFGMAGVEPTDHDGRAAVAADQTSALLKRFRPGQSIDDEIAAFERDQTTDDTLETPTPVAAVEPAPGAEPVAAVEPAPGAEPVAAQPPAPPRIDIVPQPTWQIVAPETSPPDAVPAPQPPTVPIPPPAPAEPQWPTQPEWPSQRPAAGLPFLGRPAQPDGSIESLWAESAREVASVEAAAAGAPSGRSAGGVAPCVSCGLSLSATARFCRRCGTRQG